MKPHTAYVYSGPGAGTRSVLSALQSLKQALHPSVTVDTLDTATLLQGGWENNCKLLVMPGGADLPYCTHLNGHGNSLIKEFVESGGAYLGLCAGAYYGCGHVEFELGNRSLEVQGSRELRFFPGTAKGSVYKGFDYESERGAVAAPIRYRKLAQRNKLAHDKLNNNKAALGGVSIKNNGAEGSEWAQCKDYVNGGPIFLLSSTGSLISINTRLPPGIEILATYPEHNHAAAALVCSVGLGRAVLCSTHPELSPGWLSVPSGAARSDGVVEVENNSSKTECEMRLRAELEEHEKGRWAFWGTLLVAAGLGGVLGNLEKRPVEEQLHDFDCLKN